MTGSDVWVSNSSELAFGNPTIFLANSTTAICNPRHNHRYGVPVVLQYSATSILPSTPLYPNHPGTINPSICCSLTKALICSEEVISSAKNRWIQTLASQ